MVGELKFGRRLVDIQHEEEEKFFHLKYGEEYEDVIFLYPSDRDVIVVPIHTVSDSGRPRRILCKDTDCPYCKKNMKARDTIFIPLYNINRDCVQFWERSNKFFAHRFDSLFDKFPNPSQFVFRVTRLGDLGDIATTYKITPWAKNTVLSYDEILEKFNIKFPEIYETIIEGLSISTQTKPETISKDSVYTALICKGCGAPINALDKCCNFCGTSYIW